MSNAASFSRVQTYKKCPAMYEWQYILGHKDERGPGPAAERGTRIHNSIEQAFLMEDLGLVDVEVPSKIKEVLQRSFDEVHTGKCEVMPEMAFALDKEWNPCEFEAEEAFVRGFMDNVFYFPNENKVVVHEYKTGREYDEHAEQKQLYALVSMVLWPDVEESTVVGVYIDQKKVVPTIYSRAHLPAMQYTWKRQIEMMALPMYPTRPGMHCRWCNKAKSNGGPCPFGA